MSAVGVGIGTAGASTSSTASTCHLQVPAPNNSNNAWLGRADCTNYVSVYAKIAENRNNYPDDTIISRTFNGGVSYFDGSCGNGEGYYYSYVKSSAGSTGTSGNSYNCD